MNHNEFLSVKFTSRDDFVKYMNEYTSQEYKNRYYERMLCAKNGHEFDVDGYCSICHSEQEFRVDYQYASVGNDGFLSPNWREGLYCLKCGTINRMRCVAHKIQTLANIDSLIYITEQVTPFYRWLSTNYTCVGSEYLGDQCRPGEKADGIRNEDLTCLSFGDESFTHILSFDVLEHVSNLNKSLAEVFRCLKPGGTFIFTVPFSFNSDEREVLATIDNGNIIYKYPPQFHGNPLSPEGSLVFLYPGWKLFDNLKEIGFVNIEVEKVWSKEYAYFGDIFIFSAKKESSERSRQKSAEVNEEAMTLTVKIAAKLQGLLPADRTADICSRMLDVLPTRLIIDRINEKSMSVVTLPDMLEESIEFYAKIFEDSSTLPEIILACSHDQYNMAVNNAVLRGFNVISFQQFLENPVKSLCVFSSSNNNAFDFVELLRFLDSRGFSNVFIDSETTKRTCYLFEPKVDFIYKNFGYIFSIFSSIIDEESKKIFLGILLMLETGDPGYLQISRYPQYEHPDCMAELGDTIYEGGPFDGTTTNRFAQLVGDNGQVYTFEPLKKYAELTKTNTLHNSNVHVENLGLWSGQSTFYIEDQVQGTHLQDNNTGNCEECHTIDIDSFCFTNNTQCSLIKLDIEGAEVETIKGALETINKFKPKLQIAVYHSQWIEIPSLILNNCPEYKFYFGHHDSWWWETVLYGVPNHSCADSNREELFDSQHSNEKENVNYLCNILESSINNENFDVFNCNASDSSICAEQRENDIFFANTSLVAIRQCNLAASFLIKILFFFAPNVFWSLRLLAGGAVDAAWYLSKYSDVAASNMNPAQHYLVHGWKEGRNPNPWFDTQKYLNENQDVKTSGINPLLHYCLHGAREGRSL